MSTTRAVSKSSAAHSPYQRLFMLPGAKAFCLSGAVARLPISMMSLGIVLALNHLYDNWTIAGTMSAAYVLAMSCVTPFYARAFDRFGQARVGRLALAVQIVAMLAFAFAALVRVPIPLLFALAIIMGLTQFSFGALVRTRWSYALRGVEDGEQLLNTAYAMEAAIDEIVFILGPILAAWLATSVHPVSQLFVPTVACGIGGTIFFSLKSTQPPVIVEQVSVAAHDDGRPAASEDADQLTLRQLKRSGAKPKSVLLYAGVLPLLAVFIVFNMSFTSFDVSITATMKSMGLEPFLGLQLAMFAVGSCIAGVRLLPTQSLPLGAYGDVPVAADRRLRVLPVVNGQSHPAGRLRNPRRPDRLADVRHRQPHRQGSGAGGIPDRRTELGNHRRHGRHVDRLVRGRHCA